MLKFNKIWLTPKWKWKVKIYVDEWKTLFNEIEKDDLLDLIDVMNNISYINVLNNISYKDTWIKFIWESNIFNN